MSSLLALFQMFVALRRCSGIGEACQACSQRQVACWFVYGSDQRPDLLEADGIIMGSPTYCGCMSAKLKALFEDSVKIHRKLTGRVGSVFASSGSTSTGSETTLLSILQAMLVHGMILQGRADEKHCGEAVGSPKKSASKYCEDFGRNTATLLKKLYRT